MKLSLRSSLTMTKKKIIGFQVLTLLEKKDRQPVANKLNSQYYFIRKVGKQ